MKVSVVESVVDRSVREARAMSFYIDRRLICKIIVLYLKFDHGVWAALTTSDGKNVFELMDGEPRLLGLDEIEDECAYPVRSIQLNCIGKHMKKVWQYSWNGIADELNGFYIEFEDESGLSVYEKQGCLIIIDYLRKDERYVLLPYD